MPTSRTIATLPLLRRQLRFALALQESAARRQAFHVMAGEGERIAWLQRCIAELERHTQGDVRHETASGQEAAV